ncbi:Hcp family type VI secretion system effector [Trabulsiella odontotermitis]|uniref:Hcp n=1 Tax=Trabulsiella odontotermitis TaxID=379893 RepID=A0A0L0GTI2_9ENTR|nr:Hcp family type VI secretion system effector [Trabulsiella odontotermitis]KNC92370.1 Hcp [Trabulsiella odontotermitis]
MANPVYLTINSLQQGLISAGCGSQSSIGNKMQAAHPDEIMVLSVNHGMTRIQNVNHQTLDVRKPVDKSSPLLMSAINNNEELTCELAFWRTNRAGMNENFYIVKLVKARIAQISFMLPHVINNPGGQPEEGVSFTYESIMIEHCVAGTSAYSFWDSRVM